ncbi:hypothetical protein [Oenococcus oeni]|uniref:hypothetical protein n=3 Tax=Oenococcus oeni TaxID=1247 RepID=UPI000277775B|nr:hypothetical protein [Oenococcus oeni]EJN93101.1 hypothetical protein AWRIB304_25 [Oenococcus oeni AWRIB304]KER91146.1 hypothetical protein HS16_03510 [Oenococcus oeni]KER91736.1 hypothetical protein HS16_01760 [Oenococcus oeni]KER96620.1 hypothetical protein HT64_02515 [Oenococcus oeni]OIK57468.1 hypothetical protein ATW60_10760 [Oenococcus oeni]
MENFELVPVDSNPQYWQNRFHYELSDEKTAFLLLYRNNWCDFVEIEPEKKYYLISADLENIGKEDKYLNIDKSGVIAPIFASKNEWGGWQTQFTQAEIDELGDKVSGLRKEEVK